MDNTITCCKGCKDRTVEPNCHMTCERYLEAVEKSKKRKKIINKHNNVERMFVDHKLRKK